MCFSATVSFSSGILLAAIGVATLSKVMDKKEYPLAVIPLLFAIQQFIEGFIWVALEQGDSYNAEYLFGRIYIFFAGVVWPALIPFSIFFIEESIKRKKILFLVMLSGIGFASYTLTGMLFSPPSVYIEKSHIVYHHPWESNKLLLIYVIATCLPFFCSGNIRILYLGIINVAAFFVSYYFYQFYLASVWCFFAALMSTGIYILFVHEHRYKNLLQTVRK